MSEQVPLPEPNEELKLPVPEFFIFANKFSVSEADSQQLQNSQIGQISLVYLLFRDEYFTVHLKKEKQKRGRFGLTITGEILELSDKGTVYAFHPPNSLGFRLTVYTFSPAMEIFSPTIEIFRKILLD